MIISCNNCNKKFNISSELIPDKGRLVQCSGCDHKWFFKKEIIKNPIEFVENQDPETISLLDKPPIQDLKIKKVIEKKEVKISEDIILKKTHNKKLNKQTKSNILNLLYVFIISFVALIIIVDTFKYPIGKIVPNIEFLLYNLYESIKDIILFTKDLI